MKKKHTQNRSVKALRRDKETEDEDHTQNTENGKKFLQQKNGNAHNTRTSYFNLHFCKHIFEI